MTLPPVVPFVAQTAGQARLLLDSAYGLVLKILMQREVSVGEVAQLTNLPIKQVHHRLTRLLTAGLIEVVGERPRGGRPIKLYRARSTVYQVPFALTDAATVSELVTGITQPYLTASMQAIGQPFQHEAGWEVLVALDPQQHLSITLAARQDAETLGPHGGFGAFSRIRLGRDAREEAERRMRELHDWLVAQQLRDTELTDAQSCFAGLFFTPGHVEVN